MDYSYFTAAQQPYQFLGLPPTPAHTNSANSDDFSNSPPVCSPSHSYQSLSYQSPFFAPSSYSPSNSAYHFTLTARQDDFNQYQNYDYNQFAPSAVAQARPPTPQHKPSISANNGFDMQLPMNADETQRGSNSDEDDRDMTPAQSRRKAQNRAA
jgi:AP-1-like transcription factor